MPLVTPFEKPTRLEALRYYRKVAEAYQLQIALHEEVTAVSAVGTASDPLFEVESRGRLDQTRVRTSRAVVLAMGYFDHPNRLGVPGEDLPHVSHYYHEAHPHYRQRVVVVGGKNSACETALELYRAGAHVTLVHRGEKLGESVKYWVRPDIENRIRNGSIPAHFSTQVVEITPDRGHRAADWRDQDRRHPGGSRPPAHGLPRRRRLPPEQRHRGRCRVPGAAARRPYLRDQRAEPVHRGRPAGRSPNGSVFIENGRFHGEQIARVLAERLRGAA